MTAARAEESQAPERRALFRERFLVPLRAEAATLGIGPAELAAMLGDDDPASIRAHASEPLSQERS